MQIAEIHRIAVIGAGALGSYFSSRFIEAGGFSVYFVAEGERYDRLRENGVIVNGKAYKVPVVNPGETDDSFDLIIVALKHHHLPAVVSFLKRLTGENTVVMSVMNGLDSEDIIGVACGPEKLLYAVSVGIDGVRTGNRVSYSNPGVHHFGEAENHELSERVRRIQRAFDKAGIMHTTPMDMIRTMWWKFMVNLGVNPTSAVMRAPYGKFQTMSEARDLMNASMREVLTLASAEGVDLTEKDLEDWPPVLNSLSPDGKTSMLQDIEAGSKTEVDIFCQKVVDLGKKHGIPTPVNDMLLRIIRVLES